MTISITKAKYASNWFWRRGTVTFPRSSYSLDTDSGVTSTSDVITYDRGPLYRDGHVNWKACTHTYYATSGQLGSCTGKDGAATVSVDTLRVANPYLSAAPNYSFDRSAIAAKLRDQLDLNCRETVLLYSGVLQAIPLVGGAFKFVSVFNRLAKRLSRDMRRKPFTTVVKSAISFDFIDRFVVSPTIDDARKFLNAHNYVVNVIRTATERSSQPTAIRCEASTTFDQSTSTSNITAGYGALRYRTTNTYRRYGKSQGFLLLDVGYDTNAINPIKLWATRLGVLNPLDSVWDLVPFSFVIDYFARAGDFISSLGRTVTDQEALVGKISNIYGLWGTEISETRRQYTTTSITGLDSFQTRTYGSQIWKRGTFRRFRVSDPYTLLSQLEEEGFLTLPSRKQLRTLAELIIQAKL